MATINGKLASAITMREPRVGLWSADVVLEAAPGAYGAAAELVADGHTWRGGVLRGETIGGLWYGRIIAGNARTDATVTARPYSKIPTRIVAEELATALGLTLSPTSDTELLARELPAWVRYSGRASTALIALVTHLGASWRCLRDGSLWIGLEAWPELVLEARELASFPASRRVEIAADAPTLRPGTTWAGRRIEAVWHRWRPEGYRAEVWYARETATIRGAIAALINQIVEPLVRYARVHPARVVAHRGDGLLEVESLDGAIEFPPVPLRGLPGFKLTLKPGAIVLVTFQRGDPSDPIATLGQLEGLESVKIEADTEVHVSAPVVRFRDGGRPIARVGDVMSITGTTPAGPLVGTATIMTGAEGVLA